ncbi:hypothetical protein BLOT_002182 [Blomia tropicalis]|nr:hypothetical protein BLOT_002182 [Blomia tropicalis]
MVGLTFVDEMEANNVDDVQYEANHDDDGEVDAVSINGSGVLIRINLIDRPQSLHRDTLLYGLRNLSDQMKIDSSKWHATTFNFDQISMPFAGP